LTAQALQCKVVFALHGKANWEAIIMDANNAHDTIQEVGRVQRRTRASLDGLWFPLVLFGVLTILSAGVVAVLDEAALALYWLVAGIGGGAACAWHAWRQEQSTGVGRSGTPYAVTAGLLIVGALGMGALGSGDLQIAGPPLAISLAYLVFAYLERSVALAVTAIALGVLAVTLTLSDVAQPTLWLAVGYGTAFLAFGLVARRRPAAGR
jgi:hypothetical protein